MPRNILWVGAAAIALATNIGGTPAAAQSSGDGPAANTINEVVVTARRREENVQDVPLAIQAFSQESLTQRGVVEVSDLKSVVPGLSIANGTFRESTPVPVIRGFNGQGLQIDNDPSIPFIINEVPMNTPQGQNSAFFDLENVQVLKGPQGTLQGRNTVGGAVLITTRRPNYDSFGGYVTGKLGNYDLREFETAINVPIGDRVAIRGALHRTVRDGAWINIADGRDYSDRNSWAGRLSLRAQLTDEIETTFIYDRTSVHQHGTPIVFQAKGFDFNDPSSYPANGQVIPCRTAAALCGFHNLGVMLIPGFANYLASDAAHQASLGWGKFDSFLTAATSRLGRAPYEHILNWGGTNITTWDLADDLTVKNIVGYRRLRSHHYQDIDGTSKGSSTTAGLGSVRAALLESTNIVDFEQVTEELQFQGSALDNRATWVAGTFMSRYFGVDGADAVQFGQRFMNPFYTTAKSLGVYGQVDVKFTDELTLTGGYRYSWDQRTGKYFSFQGIPLLNNSIGLLGSYGHKVVLPAVTNPTAQCNFNRTATSTHAAFAGVDPRTCEVKASLNGSAPSYNITLQYRPNEEVMVYLAHRQGYRAGFLSARATSFEGMVNDNETVRDLELGVKSDFRVADMPVRLNAATYYSWYSNIAVSVPRIDPATGLPVNQAENSGSARFYGAEATLDVRPTEALTLNATVGLNRGIYDAFPAQTVNDALGNPLIFYANKKIKVAYPHETFTLAAAYTLPLDANVGEITASVNYYHAGKRPDFNGVSNGKGFSTLPAYGLLNARLDWKSAFGKPIDLAIFGSNLTDEHYLDSVFPFEDAAGFRAGFPGAPRTYGVSLTYRFGADAE